MPLSIEQAYEIIRGNLLSECECELEVNAEREECPAVWALMVLMSDALIGKCTLMQAALSNAVAMSIVNRLVMTSSGKNMDR